MRRPIVPSAAIEYPTSDGKPLAENDPQLHAILYAVGALRVYYAARPDVYVSGDLLIYYEEGIPRVSVAPDAFVVFGVEDRMRGNYDAGELQGLGGGEGTGLRAGDGVAEHVARGCGAEA